MEWWGFFITVGTPLDKFNKPRFDMIKTASNEISKVMIKNDLIILRSTVSVSTSRNIVKPILEKSNKNFKLAFCPERTAEGNAMKELRYLPQIISGLDKKSLLSAKQLFKKLLKKLFQYHR